MTPSPMSPCGSLHRAPILPSAQSHTMQRANFLFFFSTSVLFTLSHWHPNTLTCCQTFLQIEKPGRVWTWSSIPHRDHVKGGWIRELRCAGGGSCPPTRILLQKRLRNLAGESLAAVLQGRAAISCHNSLYAAKCASQGSGDGPLSRLALPLLYCP